MSKLCVLAQKSAATAATAATKGCNTVATLFSQSGNTVATLNDTLHWLVSRLKTLFNSLVCGSSGNTLPNYSQEHEKEGCDDYPPHDSDDYWLHIPPYEADEFDHEDYDEWYEDSYEEWWDDDLIPGTSWQQEAVDEAIDEEQPGQYPPGEMGDIPW